MVENGLDLKLLCDFYETLTKEISLLWEMRGTKNCFHRAKEPKGLEAGQHQDKKLGEEGTRKNWNSPRAGAHS